MATLAWSSAPLAAPAGTHAVVTPLLVLDRPVAAHAAPAADAAVVARLSATTRLTQAPTTMPVVETARGPGGGQWLRVRLPTRPNGSTGWVPASAGSAASARWEIVVHRGARRAVVLEDGTPQASFAVVVGKPSTPTPLGTFFVVEKLQLALGVTEGPWALATSAHSDALQEFGGGDGQVALHGTTGLSGALGTSSSHGCVRFAPSAISWIATRVGLGTPVIVTR